MRTLIELENTINLHLESFVEMATALYEIRESEKFIEAGFTDFVEYVNDRWGNLIGDGNKLAEQGKIINILKDSSSYLLPTSESHVIALSKLNDEADIIEVWQTFTVDEKITASKITRRVNDKIIKDNSPRWVQEAYYDDIISSKTTLAITKIVTRLDSNLQALLEVYGYNGQFCVSEKSIISLERIFQHKKELLNEVIDTDGYISLGNGDTKLLCEVESVELDDLLSTQLLGTKLEKKRRNNEKIIKQLSGRNTNAAIANNVYEIDIDDNAVVACVFSNDIKQEELERLGLDIAFVVLTKQTPIINLDGHKGTVKQLQENIKKPKYINQLLNNIIWK